MPDPIVTEEDRRRALQIGQRRLYLPEMIDAIALALAEQRERDARLIDRRADRLADEGSPIAASLIRPIAAAIRNQGG